MSWASVTSENAAFAPSVTPGRECRAARHLRSARRSPVLDRVMHGDHRCTRVPVRIQPPPAECPTARVAASASVLEIPQQAVAEADEQQKIRPTLLGVPSSNIEKSVQPEVRRPSGSRPCAGPTTRCAAVQRASMLVRGRARRAPLLPRRPAATALPERNRIHCRRRRHDAAFGELQHRLVGHRGSCASCTRSAAR